MEQRPALEAQILARVQDDGRRAGVDVKEIRLGESVIPPELLLARRRQQLAESYLDTGNRAAFGNGADCLGDPPAIRAG